MAPTPLSNLCSLFATANECPTPDTVGIYTQGTLLADFTTVWQGLGLPQASLDNFAKELKAFVGMDDGEALHRLRHEYTRLFLTDNRLVMNCQGPWRGKKEGKEKVLFMVNPYSTEISDFMRYCGVVKRAGYNDSLDMLENEWRFCSMLAQNPQSLVDVGIDPLEKLDEFMDRFMKAWVPGYAEDVAAVTREPYFAALAGIQADFVELY